MAQQDADIEQEKLNSDHEFTNAVATGDLNVVLDHLSKAIKDQVTY